MVGIGVLFSSYFHYLVQSQCFQVGIQVNSPLGPTDTEDKKWNRMVANNVSLYISKPVAAGWGFRFNLSLEVNDNTRVGELHIACLCWAQNWWSPLLSTLLTLGPEEESEHCLVPPLRGSKISYLFSHFDTTWHGNGNFAWFCLVGDRRWAAYPVLRILLRIGMNHIDWELWKERKRVLSLWSHSHRVQLPSCWAEGGRKGASCGTDFSYSSWDLVDFVINLFLHISIG